jgi:hypothetical protein
VTEPFRVPLDAIRIKPNISRGCNSEMVIHIVHTLRCTTADVPPVHVVRLADGAYRLMDGRHRYIASIIAGRRDIPACYDRLAEP